jgi:hypothetical protein
MSPEALRALFSPESDDTLITLVTIYDPVDSSIVARIADNFTQRVSETDEEVFYGVPSNGNNYLFIPMGITLPNEEESTAPRASLVFQDVTRYLIPVIRQLTAPPKVKLEMVLSSNPNNIEVSFDSLYISNITYNADTVTCELSMIDYSVEPFPCYTFTPAFFPGLF